VLSIVIVRVLELLLKEHLGHWTGQKNMLAEEDEGIWDQTDDGTADNDEPEF
jgi:hypothetical protein